MKIAHTWSSDLGIPWSAAYDVALAERGWRTWQITPPGPVADRAVADGVRWLRLDLERSYLPTKDLVGARQLATYFARHRFDIVHTHSAKVGAISRWVAAAVGTRVVVHTVHGLIYGWDSPLPARTLQTTVEALAGRCCDAILTQSQEDTELLIRSGAVPPERVHQVGNGIDLDRFRPDALTPDARRALRVSLGVGDDEVLCLAAGRLVRGKGIAELVTAVRGLRDAGGPPVRLALAGEIDRGSPESIAPALLDAAAREGILLLGRRGDMPALWAAADVGVLASWREGRPRALMEAAATGLPILTTDARGCREVVADGVDGIVVPVRDADALARGLRTLADDAEMRRRMGARAIERARREFDKARVVAKTIAIYDALLGRPEHPARARLRALAGRVFGTDDGALRRASEPSLGSHH